MKGEVFVLALSSLKERKVRNWLTILGIIIGIAAIVTLVFVGNGLENAIREQFSKLGISNIRVAPGNLRGPPTGTLGFNNSIVDLVEDVKAVEYVNPALLNFATVEYNNKEEVLMTIGYDTKLSDKGFLDVDLKLEEGRFFRSGEKNGIIIGWKIAHDNFKKEILARSNININNIQFKVIGIFEKTGTDVDDRIYMPLEDARELFNKRDIVNVFVVKVKDGIDVEEAAEDIKRELQKHYEEEQFTVFTPKQLLSQLKSILGIVTFLLSGIAAISLVVGGIGIMNSMFTSVLERTRDIGVMKSIGATNKQILVMFLVESGLIGLIGGILGVVLGISIAEIVEIIAANFGFSLLAITLNFKIIVFMLLFSFGIGMISGVVPAYQAAKLKPVDALRYE
ncbi:ABC transporter permease [Candidatus Woesearchaeota archaeon]|nr:ABC transporter permease [Candidatus Woesearchaeota archaeon]